MKVTDLTKARMLRERGYMVLPDPSDPGIIRDFQAGVLKEFERYSRVGIVDGESFKAVIERVRQAHKLG